MAQQLNPNQVKGTAVVQTPAGNQTITQPVNTNLNVITSGTGNFLHNGLPIGGNIVRSFYPGLITFGDSICQYTGATSTSLGFVSLLESQTGGALQNYCVSGYLIQSEPGQMYANSGVPSQIGAPASPTASNNPINLEQGGKNDATLCTGDAECIGRSQASLYTVLSHRGTNNLVLPGSCTTSGTWATDSLNPLGKASSTNGSTMDCSVTTYGASAIGIAYRVYNGNAGTASVTIDGISQTPISAAASGSLMASTYLYVFTNMYTVAAGTHTVHIAVTSSTGGGNLISIQDMVGNPNPAIDYFSPPNIGSMEVIPYSGDTPYPNTWTTQVNAMKQSTVTTLEGYGYNVQWLPITNVPCVNGVSGCTGGFNKTAYIANQPGTKDPDGLSCAGDTSDTVHPNNCGHKQMFQALQVDLGLVQAFSASGGGSGLNQSIYNTDHTVLPSDGVVYMNCSSPCTLTLPLNTSPMGPITINNLSPTVPLTIVAAAGASLNNVPAALLGGITVVSYPGGVWAMIAQPGNFGNLTQVIYNGNHTLIQSDGLVYMNCSSSCTLTLPNNVGNWGPFIIASIGPSPITIAVTGGAVLGNIPSSINLTTVIIASFAGGTWGMFSQLVQSDYGFSTLSSGLTPAIATALACTPSATCVYTIANCGLNSSTAVGTLSINPSLVIAGTSFQIQSLTAAAGQQTSDNSKVCWNLSRH